MISLKFFILLFVVVLASCQAQNAAASSPKIGIIGAGIGGASTAHFLRNRFGSDADITIFEHSQFGGRLSTVQIGDRTFETGGSVIHPENLIVKELVQKMGLRAREPEPSSGFTIVTSKDHIFKASSWSFIAKLQLAWRYGIFTLLKLDNYIETMLENFKTIYPYLEGNGSFVGVSEMLHLMSPKSRKRPENERENSLLDETEISLKNQLLTQGFSELFIDELVAAAVRCNYGQMPDSIHAFVGSVALAGAQDGLWAIHGGNKKLVEMLIESSGARVLNTNVVSVTSIEGKKFRLDFDGAADDDGEVFDVVVVAAPQTYDKNPVEFFGFDKNFSFPGKFHLTMATMVRGEVNEDFFGLNPKTAPTLFIVDRNSNVNSVSKEYPVDYSAGDEVPNVWKVFSQKPLSQSEVDAIFSEAKELTSIDWLAYPHYSVPERQDENRFLLDSNLYYLSAVEWAASAMEMSAIAAKNVANMIASKWLRSEAVESQTDMANDEL